MRHRPAIPGLLLLCACAGCGGSSSGQPATPTAPTAPVASTWSVARNGSVLQINYGSGTSFPQYAALHTDSGFLRMNTGPASGWGTSAMLLPCVWSGGRYFQGAAVTAAWRVEDTDLVIAFSATISTLAVQGEVRMLPPAQGILTATVTVAVDGSVALDPRPGEAFKPVMLASMRVSASLWDTRAAFVDAQSFQIPEEGWIVQPVARSTSFGLTGGTSNWKSNAPTIDVLMDQSVQVTGWVTRSSNANDDNVGFWGATDEILRRWQYRLRATAP
jgi:hypothetical protein